MSIAKRLVGLGILITLLGGSCGDTSGDTKKKTTSSFPREKYTVNIWRTTNDTEAFREAVAGYRDEHQNISFKFTTIDPRNLQTELINALAAGTGPDIINIPNDQLPKYLDKLVAMPDEFFGATKPVTTITSKYPASVATDVIYDSRVYGIPFTLNTLALFWNKDLFQKTSKEFIKNQVKFTNELLIRAPADWSELIEVSKYLTKFDANGNLLQSGVALGTTKNVPFASDIIAAMFLEQGLSMTNPDLSGAAFHLASFDDPQVYPGADVLDYLAGFAKKDSDYYTWNDEQSDAVEAFINGEVAMMFNYQTISAKLKQRNPKLNFQTAPLPQIPNAEKIVDYAGNYSVEVVTNNSKYPQVAWDFLSFMNKNYVNDYYQIINRPSAKKGSVATTTVRQRQFRTDAFRLQVPTSQSWYKGADPAAADKVLINALDRVRDGQDALESINQAAKEFTSLLQEGS